MDRSLLSAVSGIDTNQTWLDVIGNNISNANTTGFKEDSVTFDALLAQQVEGATAPNGVGLGGVNAVDVGSGVRTAAVTPDQAQGTIEQTNDPTDAMINGNGFFIVNSQGSKYYTRDGSMSFDANGNLVTPNGGFVQGWQATATGVINNALPIGNIQVPVGLAIAPQQTQNVNFGGNLPANVAVGTVETATSQIYDLEGNALTLTSTFTSGVTQIVTGVNDKITFNDVAGAGKTATLAAGVYNSPAALAAQISVQLNASGGGDVFTVVPNGNQYVITDTTVGAAAKFQITGGDSLTSIGLQTMGATAATTAGAVNNWKVGYSLSNDGNWQYPPIGNLNTVVLNFNASGVLQQIQDSYNAGGAANVITPSVGPTTTPDGYVIPSGTVSFQLNPPTNPISPDAAGGQFTNPINLNFPATATGQNNVTQYQGNDTLQVLSQDGYASGSLAGISVGQTGVINGSFTNGQSLALGQIALSTFANPSGLSQVGNNYWQSTPNSGLALVNQPGSGGSGTLTGSALEASNVDMSTQLTNLVIAQTSYQANTRVVTTNATTLNSLIQMG